MAPARGAALVIGGSGGIGRVIAGHLAADGWDVAVTYRANREGAEAALAAIKAAGRRGAAYAVDLADAAQVAAMVAQMQADFGSLNQLTYAAGPLVPQMHIAKLTPALVAAHLTQDALGFYHVIHPALSHLRAAKGNIVTCVSAAQFRFATQDTLSVMPKAAVTALMTGLAKEEGRFGIRANAVAIGLIEAGQHLQLQAMGHVDAAYLAAAAKATPLRRAGQAADIAQAVTFFAAEERAGFVTGQILRVDGGYSI